jgi:hypothetical protein
MKSQLNKAIEFYIQEQSKIKTGDAMWNVKMMEKTKQELEELSKISAFYLIQKSGGEWLGVMREWIKQKFRNGETVTWGSNEILNGNITVLEYERIAAVIAAATLREFLGR